MGVFLTDMQNFAAMNRVYEAVFDNPKPVRSRSNIVFALSCADGWVGEDVCGG